MNTAKYVAAVVGMVYTIAMTGMIISQQNRIRELDKNINKGQAGVEALKDIRVKVDEMEQKQILVETCLRTINSISKRNPYVEVNK